MSHLSSQRGESARVQAPVNGSSSPISVGVGRVVASAVEAAQAGVEPDNCDVPARLERKFGLGSDPPRRRAFFNKLGRRVEQYGDRAFRLIAEVVAEAVHKRQPATWFCKVVVLRLREANCLGDRDAEW